MFIKTRYCPNCGKRKAELISDTHDKLFQCAICGQEFIYIGELND